MSHYVYGYTPKETLLQEYEEGRLPQQTWISERDLPLVNCMDTCNTSIQDPATRASCLQACIHEATTGNQPTTDRYSGLDRFKVPYPRHMWAILGVGAFLVATGGLLHYYASTPKKEPLEQKLGGKYHTSALSVIVLAFGGSTLATALVTYLTQLYEERKAQVYRVEAAEVAEADAETEEPRKYTPPTAAGVRTITL